MVSAVDHDPAVALAKASGILGCVWQRTSPGTGGTVKGTDEASLKMLNALLSVKTYSSRMWDTIPEVD